MSEVTLSQRLDFYSCLQEGLGASAIGSRLQSFEIIRIFTDDTTPP